MIGRIIKILTVLFLLVFPTGLIFRIKLFANAQIVPQDIVAFLLFVFVVGYYLKWPKNLKYKKFLLFQAAFILVGLLSLLINTYFYKDINVIVALLYAFRYIVYLSLLFVPQVLGIKITQKLFVFSGSLILVGGFVQYFFYNNLRNLYYLGWDDHLYRLFSSFLDPNFAGVFFVIFLFFLLYIVFSKNLKSGYVELILSFFTLIAIYLTYSRTAIVSFLIAVVIAGLFFKKPKILVSIFIPIVVLFFIFSNFTIEGLNPFRTASVVHRMEAFSNDITIFEKNPLLGVGFNAFRYAQVRYGMRDLKGTLQSNADATTDVSIFFALLTSGIFGIALFVISYFCLFKEVIRKNNGLTKVFYLCILITFIVSSFFINTLFYTPILSWLFISLALL